MTSVYVIYVYEAGPNNVLRLWEGVNFPYLGSCWNDFRWTATLPLQFAIHEAEIFKKSVGKMLNIMNYITMISELDILSHESMIVI